MNICIPAPPPNQAKALLLHDSVFWCGREHFQLIMVCQSLKQWSSAGANDLGFPKIPFGY